MIMIAYSHSIECFTAMFCPIMVSLVLWPLLCVDEYIRVLLLMTIPFNLYRTEQDIVMYVNSPGGSVTAGMMHCLIVPLSGS